MKYRDLEDLVEKAGLQVLNMERNMHYKVKVMAPDGRIKNFIFSVTPSDGRALQNQKADLRRFARGVR